MKVHAWLKPAPTHAPGDPCPKGCAGYRLISRPSRFSTQDKVLECMRCGARFECREEGRAR